MVNHDYLTTSVDFFIIIILFWFFFLFIVFSVHFQHFPVHSTLHIVLQQVHNWKLMWHPLFYTLLLIFLFFLGCIPFFATPCRHVNLMYYSVRSIASIFWNAGDFLTLGSLSYYHPSVRPFYSSIWQQLSIDVVCVLELLSSQWNQRMAFMAVPDFSP